MTLSLDKPTKTNCIRVIFKGEVEAAGDSFNLFTKQIKVATDVGTLDARTHTFSFEFLVDSNLNLPSSTKLARGSIKYGLTAIHERPLIPDALSSKAEYALQILENINAEWPEFAHEAEMCQDVMISGSNDTRKVRIIAKMPRFAFVRGAHDRTDFCSRKITCFQYSNLPLITGDIIPLELSIKHFEPFTREKGIKVELIRIALFGKSKNQTPVQSPLRSLVTDLNVSTSSYIFSATPNIMIPTSTPPTIDVNGRILNVQYQVRISIDLNHSNGTASKSNNVVLEIPIVVATWPPAAIPIDLDLEEEELESEAQSEGTESDPESGSEKPSDVPPKQVFVAPRPVRTSSLSQSSRPTPIIPLSSQVSAAVAAAVSTTATTSLVTVAARTEIKDNNHVNRVDGAYQNHQITVSTDSTVGTASASRTASHRFPRPAVSSLHETSSQPTCHDSPPQVMPLEVFATSQSGSHSHYSAIPTTQPLASGPSLSHSSSVSSGSSNHYSPNMSMPQTLSSSPGYPSPMPTPHSPSSSHDHYPVMPMPDNPSSSHTVSTHYGYTPSPSHTVSTHYNQAPLSSHAEYTHYSHAPSSSHPESTHYGHTPSISLPQMPIPNHNNSSECHYLPHHAPEKTFPHGYGNQNNAAYQMPEPVNYSQADYTTNDAYRQPMPFHQNYSYYPQLQSESDPAYAPYTFPMPPPTPGQVMSSALPMPTPNAPYHPSFSNFPFS